MLYEKRIEKLRNDIDQNWGGIKDTIIGSFQDWKDIKNAITTGKCCRCNGRNRKIISIRTEIKEIIVGN